MTRTRRSARIAMASIAALAASQAHAGTVRYYSRQQLPGLSTSSSGSTQTQTPAFVWAPSVRTLTSNSCTGTLPVNVTNDCFPSSDTTDLSARVASSNCTTAEPADAVYQQSCSNSAYSFQTYQAGSTGTPMAVRTVSGYLTDAQASANVLAYCNSLNGSANSGYYCFYQGYKQFTGQNYTQVQGGLFQVNPDHSPTTYSTGAGTQAGTPQRSYLVGSISISTAGLPGLNAICPTPNFSGTKTLVCQ